MNYIFNNCLTSFSDYNFSINPIAEGTDYLFDLSKLKGKDINELIDKSLVDKNLDELEDELGNLCGGITIHVNDKMLISPSCCGDLSDIYNWEGIINNKTNQWTKLWIGHPWVYYKVKDGIVCITEYVESPIKNLEGAKIDLPILMEINLNQLCEALKRMRDVQESFQDRLSAHFENRGFNNYKVLADCLGCANR